MGTRQLDSLVPIGEIRTEDEVALKEIGTARKKSEILRKKRDFAKIRFDSACNRRFFHAVERGKRERRGLGFENATFKEAILGKC